MVNFVYKTFWGFHTPRGKNGTLFIVCQDDLSRGMQLKLFKSGDVETNSYKIWHKVRTYNTIKRKNPKKLNSYNIFVVYIICTFYIKCSYAHKLKFANFYVVLHWCTNLKLVRKLRWAIPIRTWPVFFIK